MKNDRKGESKDPDFFLYLKQQEKKADGARVGKDAAAGDFLD